VTQTSHDLEQLLQRWLEDVMTEAEPLYWLRRADELSRIGTEWGDEAAQACRSKAAFLQAERTGTLLPPVVTCPTCNTPTSPWSCSCGQTRIGGQQ